jgi:ribosomal protein L21E
MSVINPKTNRKVSPNTQGFKNLLKDFDYNEKRKLLIPKNKTNYVFSITKNQYILKSKLSKNYEIKNDQAQLKESYIKAPTGRIIKKNGRAYNKYIKDGYQIINEIFVKPTSKIIIDRPSYDNVRKEQLRNVKIAILNVPDLNQQIIHYFKSKKEFYNWLGNTQYQFEGLDTNLELITSNDEIKFGVSYDGKLNCFIQCVEQHLNKQARKHKLQTIEEFFKTYEDGVFEEDINEIAEYYKIFIRVHENKNVYEYGKKEYTKHKQILNLKYQNNHVINITKYNNNIEQEVKESFKVLSSNEQKTEIIKYNPINTLDNLEFNKEYNNFTLNDKLQEFTEDELKSIVSINADNELTILGITLQTKDKQTIYKYSHHHGIELEDNEYSIYNKVSNEIMDYFTEKPQSIKSDLEITNQLCHNQIFYNQTLLKSNYEYKVIDIKNAYDNFKELPTDLLIKIETNKLHNELGFYYITYNCPIRNINISEWRFTEYILTLQKHNIKFSIQQAMLSSGKTTLDINKLNSIYKQHDKRFFHILLGKWQVYKFTENTITTDYELYNKYGGVEYKINDYQSIYKISIDEKISTNNYYPHIVGAIHEYTNSKLLDTILTYKLKPLRIWVDGLVFNEYPKEYPNYFRKETKKYKIDLELFIKDESHEKLTITNDYTSTLRSRNGIELPKSRVSAILGSAGTGKSYLINQISKIINNTQILTPTRMVLRNFDTNKKMTYQKYIQPTVKLTTELLLIDECTMLPKHLLNEIVKKCKCKVILFGDKKQLPVIDGENIDYNSLEVKYLTHIYRQNDIKFIEKLLYTFETGKVDYIKSKLSVKECINNNIIILSGTNDEIERINKIGYKLLNTKKINDTLKVNMPIIVDNLKLQHKNLYTGDKGFIKSYDEKNKTTIINILDEDIELTEKQLYNIKPSYSITYHRIQGQTINNNICLNLKDIHYFKEYQNNMLYVGVSRVHKLEQLHLLKN